MNNYFKSQFNHPDNAQKIIKNQILGLQRVVKLSFIIDGKEIVDNFKSFKLSQSATNHHQFELVLDFDVLSNPQNHNLEDAQKFLGKSITTFIKYKDTFDESPERLFVGVVTKVAFAQEKGNLGIIVLKGHSPTILLDSAPHTQSFGGDLPVNTSIIANSVIRQGLSSLYKTRIQVNFQGSINYSTQYNETHYNYLSRLAEAYGEQFFYDGEVLHFGSLPPNNTPIQLTYGSNVYDISIEMNAIHTKPKFFSYQSNGNEKILASTYTIGYRGDLAKQSYKINQSIFKTESLIPAPINPNMFKDVTDSQKASQGSAMVEVMTVSGNTTIPFLFPSCVIELNMRKSLDEIKDQYNYISGEQVSQTSYFSQLMITEVTHEVDARGHYTGTFKAIAEGTGFLPKGEFKVTKAEPQLATVISNVDPLNQGRVQVRFDWQKNETTNFIRVMSPDAGGTGVITQNRGYVAIPEIGDQVMVGFEYNHPDFPFVMGGMFHGKNGLGGGIQNHLRSIQTKSGIKVLMNDNEKSVTIQDPSGNIYFMDGQGNINITAPKNITFTAGDNVVIKAGKDIQSEAGSNILNLAKDGNINNTANEDIENKATNNIKNTSNNNVIEAKNEAKITGNSKTTIKGGVTEVNGSINKLKLP